MLSNVFYAVCLALFVFAVFFLCLFCFSRLLVPKDESGFYTVVAGSAGDERLPAKVFAAFIQSNIFSFSKNNPVVVLDLGVSESVRQECESLLPENGICFCTEGEFADFIARSG